MRRSGVRSSSSPPEPPKGLHRKAATPCFFWIPCADGALEQMPCCVDRVNPACDRQRSDPISWCASTHRFSRLLVRPEGPCRALPPTPPAHGLSPSKIRKANAEAFALQAECAERLASLRRADNTPPVDLSPALRTASVQTPSLQIEMRACRARHALARITTRAVRRGWLQWPSAARAHAVRPTP